MSKSKYPQMPFDTRDWLCCPELKVLSPDVRGLWMDVLCYMWESPEKGVMVSPSGKPYTQAEIVALVGLDSQGSSAWITQLIEAGVCGIREDGAIISRRMVRENELSQKRAAAGRKGGETTKCRALSQKAPEQAQNGQETEAVAPGELFSIPAEPKKTRKRAAKPEEPKIEFAQYVHLTQKDYDKLVADFGTEAVSWMINKLNNTVGSNTKRYKYTNDYLAIRNWVVDCYFEKARNGKQEYREPGSHPQETGGFATGTTL